MAEKKQRSIGRILIEKGIVTEEQVAHALEIQRENPKIRLGEALVQMQAANWDQVYEALAELLGYRFVDLRMTRIPAEAIESMPKPIARKHNIVPVGEEEGVLVVAITDPFDLYAMDSLRFYLNREVRCVLAAPDAVEEAINKYYGIEESTVDNMLAEFTESDLGIQTAIEASQEDGEDSAMIRLVTLLISEAVKLRASDIHIEPMKTKLRVRYRVDGNCQEMDSPPKKLQGPIISRVKILAGIDIAEKRRPTDGRIAMRVGGQSFDIRVSCLPATHGESVVMRLLMKESVLINLQELGFHETRLPAVREHHQAPERHLPRHRPHRLRQDHHALRRAPRIEPPRQENHHRRKPRRIQPLRHQPVRGEGTHRADLRRDPPLDAAPGAQHHPRRRNPRRARPPRSPSRPPSPATWSSARCTPTTPPRPSRV